MPLGLNDKEEDLSKAMVQSVCAIAGVCVTTPSKDRISRDLIIEDVDIGRHTSYPSFGVQLKATTRITVPEGANDFTFPLPVKNYNDLRAPSNLPTILIVALLPETSSDWFEMTPLSIILRHSLYWCSLRDAPPTNNKNTKSVRIPIHNRFTPEAVRDIMNRMRNGGSP